MSSQHRVVALKQEGDLREVVGEAMSQAGILSGLERSTRVSIKPNLTYPFYKRGVTTSPLVVSAVVQVLRRHTDHVALVECDGGYGAWKVEDAFEGHGLYEIGREHGVEVASLHEGARRPLVFQSGGIEHQLDMPVRLLDETDLFITMPVPKIHCMTGLTLAHKNQWGCIPDDMRLRRHYVFDDAITAINEALSPTVVGDGTWFLDQQGPLEGEPVSMDLVIAASTAGAFDRYVSELMGWSYERVSHLRKAAERGTLPRSLDEIEFNVPPEHFRTITFELKRTVRNYIALSAFKTRFMTWLGYDSFIGREIIHPILYSIVGDPPKPDPRNADTP